MKIRFTAMGCMILLAAPLTAGHDPVGTPKNYCEDPAEWSLHDYAPPATGLAVFLLIDGNFAQDCNGDTTPADYDGHQEFAFGGGWLMVNSGDGATGGSIACYGEVGHHPAFGPIAVEDVVLGSAVTFRVEADAVTLVPPTDPGAPNCGDFQTDQSTACTSPCTVTFPEGLDGAYVVYVGDAETGGPGSHGHFGTSGEPGPDLGPVFIVPDAFITIDYLYGVWSFIPPEGWDCSPVPRRAGMAWGMGVRCDTAPDSTLNCDTPKVRAYGSVTGTSRCGTITATCDAVLRITCDAYAFGADVLPWECYMERADPPLAAADFSAWVECDIHHGP